MRKSFLAIFSTKKEPFITMTQCTWNWLMRWHFSIPKSVPCHKLDLLNDHFFFFF